MSGISAASFLDRRLVDLLHAEALRDHGGLQGVRDNHALDSAVGRAVHVRDYLVGCDYFDIAAAYAHGIAEAQGYVDGNKRTGISAALIFLESNGISTESIPDDVLHDAMISAANRAIARDDLAEIFRKYLD